VYPLDATSLIIAFDFVWTHFHVLILTGIRRSGKHVTSLEEMPCDLLPSF